MDHIDLTAARHFAEPLSVSASWYARIWAAVSKWLNTSTTEAPVDTARKRTKLRLDIEDQALKAARRWVDRDPEELVELFRHTARLLGLEDRIVVRPAATKRGPA